MTSRKQSKIGDGHYDKSVRLFRESEHVYTVSQSHYSSATANVANTAGAKNKRTYSASHTHNSSPDVKRAREEDVNSRRSVGGQVDSNMDRKDRSSQSSSNREGNAADSNSNISDWSQHISSSGKTYYYNKRTEKSQWEKPSELRSRDGRGPCGKDRKTTNNNRNIKNGEKRSQRTAIRRDSHSPQNDRQRTKPTRQSSGDSLSNEAVRSFGSATAASSTSSNRPNSHTTPDAKGNTGSSSVVQDISPASSPTSSNLAMISPCSSNSPLFSQSHCSPKAQVNSPMICGLSLSMLSGSNFPTQHPNERTESVASIQLEGQDGDKCASKLHPLQQATLLRQQQMLGLSQILPSSASPSSNVSHVHSDQGRHQRGKSHMNGPLSVSTSSADVPPPPPPQYSSRHLQGSQANISRTEGQDRRNSLMSNRSLSDPRVTSVTNDHLNSRDGSRCGSPVRSSHRPSQEADTIRWSELPNVESYSACCLTNFQDFSIGWYGILFDKQADSAMQDTDFVQSIESGKSCTSLLACKSLLSFADMKKEVGEKRLSCFKEVAAHLTSLQDHRSGS